MKIKIDKLQNDIEYFSNKILGISGLPKYFFSKHMESGISIMNHRLSGKSYGYKMLQKLLMEKYQNAKKENQKD